MQKPICHKELESVYILLSVVIGKVECLYGPPRITLLAVRGLSLRWSEPTMIPQFLWQGLWKSQYQYLNQTNIKTNINAQNKQTSKQYLTKNHFYGFMQCRLYIIVLFSVLPQSMLGVNILFMYLCIRLLVNIHYLMYLISPIVKNPNTIIFQCSNKKQYVANNDKGKMSIVFVQA